MSKIKECDITIDHNAVDEAVQRHPVLNDGKGNAYIMTSNEFPQSGASTIPIEQTDVVDFIISKQVYVSNRKVTNNNGKVIGKVKKSFWKTFLKWTLSVGTISIFLIILFKSL